MNIKIMIATHKKYNMPSVDIYTPLQVGKSIWGDIGYLGDDTGDNISNKNKRFCELTGIYWAWKNLKCDIIGFVQYRRYFCNFNKTILSTSNKFSNVLSEKKIIELMSKDDIVLPKKRKYYIMNLYEHYKNTLYVEPLDKTFEIIKAKYPDYYNEVKQLKKRTSAHMFNMFIMKKSIFDNYCAWLFDILFELEKQVNIDLYDDFHKRFFGRISEILLDVWINTNGYKYEEVKIMDMEKINWPKKILLFLISKFTGKKYTKSF